jgi:hypothetical protein
MTCVTDHKRNVVAQVETPGAIVDEDVPVNFRRCDVSKEILTLKLGKVCGFDDISNECLRHLPRRPLVHLNIYSITAFGLDISRHLGRRKK